MENCAAILLSDAVDQYCILTFNDKKQYYTNHLFLAKLAWKELFLKTFYSAINLVCEVKKDATGYYIDKPKGIVRVLSVSVDDECGRHPLLINPSISMDTVKLPSGKCKSCDSYLCDIIESNITIRQEVFNGITYTLKTFTERNLGGDIYTVTEKLEYDQKSNTVEKVQHREKTCTLEVYSDCGCPKPTAANVDLLRKCGCDCAGFTICCNPCEKPLLKSKYGYYNHTIDGNKIRLQAAENTKLPNNVILAHQTNGEGREEELMVPEYGLVPIFAGIKFFKTMYRENMTNRNEESAKRNWESEKSKMALFLAPFDPVMFRKIQSIMPKWG